MRILFSSDLHGDRQAYDTFAGLLGGYDCGVLSGDLLDEFIPVRDAVEFGLRAADEPEELHGEDFDEVAVFESKYLDALHNPRSINRVGLERKKRLVADILSAAGKPVFFVTGNHDVGGWPDMGQLINVEDRLVQESGYKFIGVKSSFSGIRSTFHRPWRLSRMVDFKTILVSHAPPFGVLDQTEVRDGPRKRIRAESIGSKSLRRLVVRHVPRYCLFGHVHEGFGRVKNMINGSWLMAHQFVSIDVDSDEVQFISSNDDPEKRLR